MSYAVGAEHQCGRQSHHWHLGRLAAPTGGSSAICGSSELWGLGILWGSLESGGNSAVCGSSESVILGIDSDGNSAVFGCLHR